MADNSVRKEISKSAISVDTLRKGENQKPGTITAQIRQTVTTTAFYPSKKVDSDKQDNIFSLEEFGFGETAFTSHEERVAWIPVPETMDLDTVKQRVLAASNAGACIYKVLSNEPILDDNQKYAITQGLRTMDQFADTQVVRYPENDATVLNGTANKLILDEKGNPQYRRTFFWKTSIADQDMRDPSKVYTSPAILAEMQGASVLDGQTI